MTVRFSKEFFAQDFIVSTQSEPSDGMLRFLIDEKEPRYGVDELVSLAIRDADFEEDTDKSIDSFSLVHISNNTLTFSLQFSDPDAISQDLLDPDILDIEFLEPQIIIDAVTKDSLPVDEAKFSLECVPLMSQDRIDYIASVKETTKSMSQILFWL